MQVPISAPIVLALDAELHALAAAVALRGSSRTSASRLREIGHRRPAPVARHLAIGEEPEEREDVGGLDRPQSHAIRLQRRHDEVRGRGASRLRSTVIAAGPERRRGLACGRPRDGDHVLDETGAVEKGRQARERRLRVVGGNVETCGRRRAISCPSHRSPSPRSSNRASSISTTSSSVSTLRSAKRKDSSQRRQLLQRISPSKVSRSLRPGHFEGHVDGKRFGPRDRAAEAMASATALLDLALRVDADHLQELANAQVEVSSSMTFAPLPEQEAEG